MSIGIHFYKWQRYSWSPPCYTVLKQVHLMTRAKGVSVSCKHLHKLFCFVFLPFYYRLRFEMVIHTWRWILCHLSWLVFRGNLPNGQQPQLVSVSVSILCHKHKFSLHKNCSTHRHPHARVYWLYILYIQRNSEPAETEQTGTWGGAVFTVLFLHRLRLNKCGIIYWDRNT